MANATYHTTRAALGRLTAHEDHVRVVWLPTSSPEPGAIEGLWGYLGKSALNNDFFGTTERLASAIDEALAHRNEHPEPTLSLAYKTSQNSCRTA